MPKSNINYKSKEVSSQHQPTQKRHNHTIPIHRNKFKSKFLQKHASLLRRRDKVYGLLVSCPTRMETRALGQVIQAVDGWIQGYFPNVESSWEEKKHEEEFGFDVDLKVIADDGDQDSAVIDEKNIDLQNNDIEEGEGTKKEYYQEKITTEKKNKRIQAVDTGCSGILFIRFRIHLNPTEFITTILDSLAQEYCTSEYKSALQKQVSHCSKFIPIEYVSNCTVPDMTKMIQDALSDFFLKLSRRPHNDDDDDTTTASFSDMTFAVLADTRNNPQFKASQALKQIVFDALPNDKGIKIDLKNPTHTFYLTVFKSVAGFSILPGYIERHKYNIHQF